MKKLLLLLLLSISYTSSVYAGTFQIDGEFNGCDYNKYYPIYGYDLLLKCEEYNYFYEYMPEVRTDGREVITIGDQRIEAVLIDGRVIKTNVSDEFEGCDWDKPYDLDNGLIFVCSTYSYSYRPDVMIIVPAGRNPIVYIDGEQYDGTLYER